MNGLKKKFNAKKFDAKKIKKIFHKKWMKIFLICCCVSIVAKSFLFFYYSPLKSDIFFDVKSGDVLSDVSARLKNDGAIPSEFLFKILMYSTFSQNGVMRGEYMIPADSSMWTVMLIVTSGRNFQYSFTAPEGLTVKQIFENLNADERLGGKISADVSDGEMLPDTYFFHRGTTRDEIVSQMRSAMAEFIDAQWKNRSADKNILRTKSDAIILASIVEKETRVPSERAIIASVLMNRLRAGMRLQMDTTVVYAVTNGYGHMRGKPLYSQHLEIDSRYNTYRYSGLPKGAICNPGRESIRAVLHPATTEYLYFVADGNGGHVFAKTLEEHEKNRKKWKEIKRNLQ